MSRFEAPVFKIDRVTNIEGKDNIVIVNYKDYQMVVRKETLDPDAWYAYIPEDSIVPEPILAEMGLVGKLAGSQGNRVKAVRFGGVLSQGLCYKLPRDMVFHEGYDAAEFLGLTKYEQPIPQQLSGKVRMVSPKGPWSANPHFHSYTDIENIKKWPGIFAPDERVFITEKLHGTCHICGIIDGEFFVTSKGIASRGWTLERDEENTYWKQAIKSDLEYVCRRALEVRGAESILLFGEMIGVQDLKYGLTGGTTAYRLFDHALYGGDRYQGYQGFVQTMFLASCFCIPIVPWWCRPFSELESFIGGNTMVGNPTQIREGVVVRPITERHDPKLGRVILKAISEQYLTRRNGTEYN